MKRRLHVIAGALFVVVLLYDLFLWGGLAQTPNLGPAYENALPRAVSLARLYTAAGRPLVGAAGMDGAAAEHAQSTFASREASLLQNPSALMDNLVSDLPFVVNLAYYGAPLLLLVFLVLWWLRPRTVHVMGR